MARRPASDRAERERMRTALVGLRARPGPLDLAVRVVVRAGFGLVGWRVRADSWECLPRDARGRVATLAAWVLERRADASGDGTTSLADGWFLALAGLAVALAALLVVGFTLATLALVAAAYLVWLAAIVLWRRRTARAVPA